MQAVMPNKAEIEQPKSWWSALAKSPLARAMTGGFLIIATVEAIFMAVLCLDVEQANRAASREFELLHASQQISHIIKTAQKCLDAADLSRKAPKDKQRFADYETRYKETIDELNQAIDNFDKVGLDTTGAKRLRDSFIQLNDILHRVLIEVIATENGDSGYKQVIQLSGNLYKEFFNEILVVHKSLKSHSAPSSIGGIQPGNLLYLAALVDVIMLLIMVLLVERSITSPISKLTINCERILKGQLMPEPSKRANEIASLERSFFEMSVVVSENEKRRHSFLSFFQSVQSAALENVRRCFDTLLQHDLQDRARRNIQKARTNLATLIQLLQSMTDALSFKADSSIQPEYARTTSAVLTGTAAAAVESLLQKTDQPEN